MPVNPGSVLNTDPLFVGFEIFLNIFCDPKVFDFNLNGFILLFFTVSGESIDTNSDL